MDIGCVAISVWILVVLRFVYVYWLCCVEVIVCILVVWR